MLQLNLEARHLGPDFFLASIDDQSLLRKIVCPRTNVMFSSSLLAWTIWKLGAGKLCPCLCFGFRLFLCLFLFHFFLSLILVFVFSFVFFLVFVFFLAACRLGLDNLRSWVEENCGLVSKLFLIQALSHFPHTLLILTFLSQHFSRFS